MGENTMKNQDKLRQQVKLAKALNGNEWNYKSMSEVININKYSFYNWLNGAYELSDKKAYELIELINELLA